MEYEEEKVVVMIGDLPIETFLNTIHNCFKDSKPALMAVVGLRGHGSSCDCSCWNMRIILEGNTH